MGFGIVGYGCTTCIGNSGPLTADDGERGRGARHRAGRSAVRQPQFPRPRPPVARARLSRVAAAGRRLCARRRCRCATSCADPMRTAADGRPCILRRTLATGARDRGRAGAPRLIRPIWARLTSAPSRNPLWHALDAPGGAAVSLGPRSTEIRRPPFAPPTKAASSGAMSRQPLLVLGDDVTTDHISPAGAIPPDERRWPITWSRRARTATT